MSSNNGSTLPLSHWFITHYAGESTRYYDLVVDLPTLNGGTGLIYLVGEVDGSPLVTAINRDGSVNWSKRFNVIGSALTVTKRLGVYAPIDELIFVGGIMYGPYTSAFLLVLDGYNGNIIDSWSPSTPGMEGEKINDLIVGPEGDIYGVGSVFTNINSLYPYNTLLFRYDPENRSIIYSVAYDNGVEGMAITLNNSYLYTAEKFGKDMIIRKVDYVDGSDIKVYNISNKDKFQIIPYDIEINEDGVFIAGSLSTTSLFLGIYPNMTTIKNAYSHTETVYRSLEIGDQNKLYVFGDTKYYDTSLNKSHRDLVFLSFLGNTTANQSIDVYFIGGMRDDYSGGFQISNYGYVTGYTESYPQISNISGYIGLITTNISDMLWQPSCMFNQSQNVSVKRWSVYYINFDDDYIISNISIGYSPLTPNNIHMEEQDTILTYCIANDQNIPEIISEFPTYIVIPLTIIFIILMKRKFLGRSKS